MKIRWNEVTWYSRLFAAIFLLGIFPALAFYIGMRYQETVSPYDSMPPVSRVGYGAASSTDSSDLGMNAYSGGTYSLFDDLSYDVKTGKISSSQGNAAHLKTKALASGNLLVEAGPTEYFGSNPNGYCGAGCTPPLIKFFYVNSANGAVTPVPFVFHYLLKSSGQEGTSTETDYHNVNFSDEWGVNTSSDNSQNFFLTGNWSIFSAFHFMEFSADGKPLVQPFWKRIDFCFSEHDLSYKQCGMQDNVKAPVPENYIDTENPNLSR